MRKVYFLSSLMLSCFLYGYINKTNNHNQQDLDIRIIEEQDRKFSIGTLPIKGIWGGLEQSLNGATYVYDKDSIIIGIATNQIWIQARAKYNSATDLYDLFLVKPTDLGRGGMTLDWSFFSKVKPFGNLKIICDSLLIKNWIGFYNDSTKKIEKKWAYDWDSCDTLKRY